MQHVRLGAVLEDGACSLQSLRGVDVDYRTYLETIRGEEEKLTEQETNTRIQNPDQLSTWIHKVNDLNKMTQEKTDLDESGTEVDKTRHWVATEVDRLKEKHAQCISGGGCSEDCDENVQFCSEDDKEISQIQSGVTLPGGVTGHEMCRTAIKRHTCRVCGDSFTDGNSLTRHHLAHTSRLCSGVASGQLLKRISAVKRHHVIGSGDKPYICVTCGKSFKYSSKLIQHERVHTGVKPYSCETCGKSFSLRGNLKSHAIIHTSEKPYICDTCGNSYKTCGLRKRHELTHTGERPYKCEMCGQSFTQTGHLKSHEMTHRSEKPFICDTCGMSFTTSGHLKRHDRTHTGEKPYSCDTCGRLFTRARSLKHHENVHAAVKPYTRVTCGKSLTRLRYLGVHKIIHSYEKTFTCGSCGKSFRCLRRMKEHETVHVAEKPYTDKITPRKCRVTEDTHSCSSDDYNVPLDTTTEEKNLGTLQDDVSCSQQRHFVGDGDTVSLQVVKCVENKYTEQEDLQQLQNTNEPPVLSRDLYELAKVRQEKIDPDECDRDVEETRHWVVSEADENEVKGEPTQNVSETSTGEGCSKNDDQMQQLRSTDGYDINQTKSGMKLNQICELGFKPCMCSLCGQIFTDVSNLALHQLIHSSAIYSGDACGKVHAKCWTHNKSRETVYPGEKTHTCDTCGKTFSSLGNLREHTKIHTGEKPYTCRTCGKSFTKSSHRKAHEMSHTGEKPYACRTCGNSFTTSNHLKVHEMIHTGVKPYTCTTCGKSFTQFGNLTKHEMTHTGEKPYSCDKCGRAFAHSSSLKQHLMTHTGEKPYPCNTCGKTFKLLCTLKQHKKTHTDVKPFTCTTCRKSFRRLSHLNMHERTHTGVKPCICTTCGKSFVHSGHLKDHERTHTGVKPFACDSCGKSFTRCNNLRRHKMTHMESER